ncbi:hypothetical protein PTKIN_Ptkin08bG0050300 [Pterospermum kingtungense]
MLPTRDQTPTTIQTNPIIRKFLPAIAFYLTFNSISIIYQAYTHGHGDFYMAAFIVFVYLGYFCLIYCITKFQTLPPLENSPRKIFLKSVIWFLTSVILFGLAYQFFTFIHPVAAVFVFAIAVSAGCLLFFLYFLHDGYHHHQLQKQSASSSYRHRINMFWRSLWSCKVISNGKMKQVVPAGSENV